MFFLGVYSNMWQLTNGNGVTIPTGADLYSNTYKVPGVYICHSNSDSNFILNCPLSDTAFSLFVYKTLGKNAEYIMQEFRAFDGRATYKRIYFGASTGWGKVYSYRGD